MFDKLTSKLGNIIESASDIIGIGKIQDILGNKISDLLELVYAEREADSENGNLNPEKVKEVINGYALKNIALSTATSFIPGPAGVLASIPSTVQSYANQMRATYDISCAYDKESFINKDALLDIPLQAMGIPTGLAKLQNADNLVDSAKEILIEKAKGVAKTIAERKLKGALTQMVPGLSTAFAIAQAKMDMTKVGSTSITFFDPKEVLIDPVPVDTSLAGTTIQEERIKALVNLMTLDSKTTELELSFIQPIIDNSGLHTDLQKEYNNALGSSKTDYSVDYDILLRSGLASELILDLAVLTKRDGEIGPREVEYVKFVAENLNINKLVYEQVLD